MRRRYLAERTGKSRQRRFDLFAVERNGLFGDDIALGVLRCCRHAEAHVGTVMLVGVEQKARELGCFAEAQRQEPRRHRIERSGMARFLGVEQTLRALECGVRR